MAVSGTAHHTVAFKLRGSHSMGTAYRQATVSAHNDSREGTHEQSLGRRLALPLTYCTPATVSCTYVHRDVDAQSRRALGPTPSLDEVAFLVQEASDCQDTMESEAGWNMMVRYPVLSKAVYGLDRGGHLIGVKPCTTARIIKE